MPDRKLPTEPFTPVPTVDLHAIAKNMNRVGTELARIRGAVDTIKDDILPPVQTAAGEARDGVLTLTERVRNIESAPPPPHVCEEKERQGRQDTDIAESRVRLSTFGRFLLWAAGAALVVAGSTITFAITSRSSAAENATKIQSQDSQIARQERAIAELRQSQRDDRETFLRAVNDLPRKVRDEARTAPDVTAMENAAEGLPLNEAEQRQLLILLNRAKVRGEQR